MSSNLYKLFKIANIDLLCLLDMEHNGILFNTEEAMKHAEDIKARQLDLLREFHTIVGSDVVSITSNDHLSAVLYGGSIVHSIRIPIGYYKSGAKTGEVRFQIQNTNIEFPRLVEPLEGTETSKSKKRVEEGKEEKHTLWEVNEPVLRSLKAKGEAKKLLTIILEYSKLDKLRGTYLEGYTKLIEEMHWPHNMLHPNFNQCTVVTGRLSSSKPNAQNMDKQTKAYMQSRYDNC